MEVPGVGGIKVEGVADSLGVNTGPNSISKAISPFSAVVTAHPSRVRRRVISFLVRASSSTTSTDNGVAGLSAILEFLLWPEPPSSICGGSKAAGALVEVSCLAACRCLGGGTTRFESDIKDWGLAVIESSVDEYVISC